MDDGVQTYAFSSVTTVSHTAKNLCFIIQAYRDGSVMAGYIAFGRVYKIRGVFLANVMGSGGKRDAP